jgi:uncharacterized protein (DUF362 family)
MLYRRELLKLAGAGIAAWAAGIFSRAINIGTAFAQSRGAYQLAAVRNASPDKLFDEGIKALGGMTAFVKKGQKVLIKPNCAQVLGPEFAANTNPLLIKRIIEHAKDAGASKIYVFDHSLGNTQACYRESGIEEVCRSAGGIIVPADSEKYYQIKEIPGAKRLKKTAFHEIFLDADVVINVPVLKHHYATSLTMSMKNLMGVIWDRWYLHSNDLHQCIADLALFRKPDLNVIDAYNMLLSHGPRGGELSYVKNVKTQILSRDIVAADAAGAKIFGLEPDTIQYIRIAHDMKIGTKNLDALSIARIAL